MNIRKICAVSGSRADYGHLFWILRAIKEDPSLQLQIVVTGSHLSPEYGNTYKEIESDGFKIDEKVRISLTDNSPAGVIKSLAEEIIKCAEAFQKLKPDIIVLLGDRYEIFAAAQSAMIAKIPIAHIHGGELTEGAIDEAMRHSITKMSHLHFTGAEPYRRRVIQLGEDPKKVFCFGAPGLDHIKKTKFLSKKSLEKILGFKFRKRTFIVTYHPATLGLEDDKSSVQELLKALDEFPDAGILFTKHNADPGGAVIGREIDKYVRKNSGRAKIFPSLGYKIYLSAVKCADLVIGNSSSGLIEVPLLKKPTVNIGDRQKGRLRAESVIDCPAKSIEIVKTIKRALSKDFQAKVSKAKYPYGEGDAGRKIKEVLKKVDLSAILVKRFFDI